MGGSDNNLVVIWDRGTAEKNGKTPSIWSRLLGFFEVTRKILSAIIMLCVAGLIAAVIYQSLTQSVIVITSVTLPTSISESGYSPEAFSHLLRVRLLKFKLDATSSKATPEFNSEYSVPDIAVLDAGISLSTITKLIRDVTGLGQLKELNVVVFGENSALRYRIVVTHGDAVEVLEPPRAIAGIEGLVEQAAEQIEMSIDPYIVASTYRKSNPAKANQILDRIILGPLSKENERLRVWAHILKSEMLFDRRMDLDALRETEIAISLDDRNAVAHLNRGSTLIALGRNVDAREAFKKSLSLDPEYSLAHLAFANALASEPEPDLAAATEHYRLAIEYDPYEPRAHFALANHLSKIEGSEIEVVIELKRAILTSTSYPRAHLVLANILRSTDLQSAIEHYQICLVEDNANVECTRALETAEAELTAP